jgi:phospholipid/cholesterol/gamma-HCH transport system substrate-binding protein
MKFSIRFADQIVGAFVILALIIVVFVVVMIGRSQRWFANDSQYRTYLPSANGLSLNMEIQYKGFSIGRVKNIKLTEERRERTRERENEREREREGERERVEVTFTIFNEHNHRVVEGSLVEVSVSPIGLGSSFIFYPGKGTEHIPEDGFVPEIGSRAAQRLISRGIADKPDTGDNIGNIINQVNTLLETINLSLAGSRGADRLTLGRTLLNVEEITGNISTLTRSLDSEISAILTDIKPVIDGIPPILKNVEGLTDKISDPSGTVMSILDAEGPVYQDITDLLDAITGIIQNLERISEFVPDQLPQVAVLISDLHPTLKAAEEVLVSLTNNPLLKGGVPKPKETGPGAATPRDLEF